MCIRDRFTTGDGPEVLTLTGGATGLYCGYVDFSAWDIQTCLLYTSERWSGVRLCPRRYRHPGLGAVCRRAEPGEPGGIGLSVPGVGDGTAGPGGDDPGKHGSCPAGGHWTHVQVCGAAAEIPDKVEAFLRVRVDGPNMGVQVLPLCLDTSYRRFISIL